MSLSRIIERYREMRRNETLKKACTFREFMSWSINYLTLDVCGKFGVTGGRIVDYQAFAKKVFRDWWEMILESSINPSQVTLDDIFDYYEKVWAIPRNLDPKVIRELEHELIALFGNVDRLKEEYEKLVRSGGTYD
jgi:hypothetical protein